MSNSRGFQLSAMDQLILQRKLDQEMKTEEEKANLSQLASLVQVKSKPTSSIEEPKIEPSKLDDEDHPERAIPDIPENKRVRDYLKSQPLMGHGAAFGKAIRVVQCYRCKCYGHRPGDPECKYTESGDLNLELQKRIREDPMYCFKKIRKTNEESDKIQRIKELLQEAKEEKRHHRHKHRHKHKHRKDEELKHRNHYSSSSESS